MVDRRKRSLNRNPKELVRIDEPRYAEVGIKVRLKHSRLILESCYLITMETEGL